MIKTIFRNGKWYRDGQEIQEPESKIDFTKPIKINVLSRGSEYCMKEAEALGQEIDNHNIKQEQKETEENKKELENLTKDFIKQNNLL